MGQALSQGRRELEFFTENVDGRIYGGWYRLLASGSVEVLSIGLMRQIPLTVDITPEALARQILRSFVDGRIRSGDPMPSLGRVLVSDAGTVETDTLPGFDVQTPPF